MEVRKVTVTHFFDDLRDEYENIFMKLQKKYGLDEEVEYDDDDPEKEEEYQQYSEELAIMFQNLKKSNYKLYVFVLTLLYHDYILGVSNKKDPLYDVLEEHMNHVRSNVDDIESLLEYLEDNTDFYTDLVEEFIEFNENTYFEKRKIYLNSKDDSYLFKIFPNHIIDKLYYVISYTEEDLMSYFIEEGMSAVGVIISLLQNLYKVDENNFNKLIEPLIYKYYKNFRYKKDINESDKDNDELLTLIENKDIEEIKKEIIGSIDFLEYIILEFYNDSFVYDEERKSKVEKEYSKHKIKKLEEMM